MRRLLAFCATSVALAACNEPLTPETDYRNLPTAVVGAPVFAELTLGDFHSCGLTPTGQAYCWGVNSQGQSGNGLTGNQGTPTPLPVLGNYTFTQLTAGGSHTCGIVADGATACWGNNAGGQLGTGSTISRHEPTPISGAPAFTSISASTVSHTCALTAAGAAWCWGSNEFGRLGDGTQTNRVSPVAVSGGIVFTSITAGGGHTCGLTAAGTAYCWGLNSRGQVGDGTTTVRLVPVPVATTQKFKSIVAGLAHTCALAEQNTAWCWGDNVTAALGDGTTDSKSTPVEVSGGSEYLSLALGERHACALALDGIVLCWGYNQFGALGDGTFITRAEPVTLAQPILFKRIAAGGYHTCGISQSDATYCWGINDGGQVGAIKP